MADAQPPEGQSEGPPSGQAGSEGTAAERDTDQTKDARLPWYRVVAAAVLLLAAIGLVLWLFLARPDSLAHTAVLILLAGAACGGFAVSLPARLRKVLVPLAIVAGTVIGVLAAVLAIPDRTEPAHPLPSLQSPTSPSPSASAATEVLFDDFNSPADDKWTLSGGPDPKQLSKQIYTAGGRLHLVVSPENSAEGADAELKAKLPSDWTITKISVKMTLERQYGKSDGAAYLSILSFEERENRAWMGPGGENQNLPMLGFCRGVEDGCEGEGEDQHEIRLGQQYQIEAIATRKDSNSKRYLTFHVIGHEDWEAYVKPDAGEIRSFRFYVSSDPKRDFHVTVDEIRITYV